MLVEIQRAIVMLACTYSPSTRIAAHSVSNLNKRQNYIKLIYWKINCILNTKFQRISYVNTINVLKTLWERLFNHFLLYVKSENKVAWFFSFSACWCEDWCDQISAGILHKTKAKSYSRRSWWLWEFEQYSWEEIRGKGRLHIWWWYTDHW